PGSPLRVLGLIDVAFQARDPLHQFAAAQEILGENPDAVAFLHFTMHKGQLHSNFSDCRAAAPFWSFPSIFDCGSPFYPLKGSR
ncbi:hypothetical protein LJC63_05965, partial [Ruminococcaceae bacterium OttesenSCG-928-L11]|nr:hypothetical protein [Ruminococcaceae bacterium OttesenSCG-928-L11]